MTAEQNGLDPAEVQAQHKPYYWSGPDGSVTCSTCAQSELELIRWPCLPYRLAALALDLQGKVARLEGYAQQRAIAAHSIGHKDTEGRWLDVLRILEQP